MNRHQLRVGVFRKKQHLQLLGSIKERIDLTQ
jgi:hypothetical protein